MLTDCVTIGYMLSYPLQYPTPGTRLSNVGTTVYAVASGLLGGGSLPQAWLRGGRGAGGWARWGAILGVLPEGGQGSGVRGLPLAAPDWPTSALAGERQPTWTRALLRPCRWAALLRLLAGTISEERREIGEMALGQRMGRRLRVSTGKRMTAPDTAAICDRPPARIPREGEGVPSMEERGRGAPQRGAPHRGCYCADGSSRGSRQDFTFHASAARRSLFVARSRA